MNRPNPLDKFWASPAKTFVVFFLLLNLAFFSLDRLLILYSSYLAESVLHDNDKFVYELCLNETIRANLGVEYREFCEKAEVAAGSWVLLRALKRMISRTYLCGDTPCIDVLERVLEIVTRSMAWTMAAFFAGVVFVLGVGLWWCSRVSTARTKHSTVRQNTVDVESFVREEPMMIYQIADDGRASSSSTSASNKQKVL